MLGTLTFLLPAEQGQRSRAGGSQSLLGSREQRQMGGVGLVYKGVHVAVERESVL